MKKQKQRDIIVKFLLSLSEKRNSENVFLSRNNIDSLKIDTSNIKSCLKTLEMMGCIEMDQDISHDFLNDSYPLVKIKLLNPCFEYFKNKRAKKRKKIIGTVVTSASLLLTVTYIISNITTTQRNIQEITKNENPPYVCDSNIKWYDLDCAYNLLTNKSEVDFYCNNSGYYYNGICLYALFSNKENMDRSIVSFTVSANDIVEDLSPRLSIVDVKDYSDPIEIQVGNFGWGETGKIYITIKDIYFNFPEDREVVDITLNDEVVNIWEFPSILPGESLYLPFTNTNIFNVIWKDLDKKEITFNITVEAYIPGTDYKDSHNILMAATHDNVYVAPQGRGGGELIENNYGVVIDTSSSNFSEEFPTYQNIPANQIVEIPIFIFPTKSCLMSIKIIFELDDGEKIETQLFNNIQFEIPYYEDLKTHILNDSINVDELPGEPHIFFPYVFTEKSMPPRIYYYWRYHDKFDILSMF